MVSPSALKSYTKALSFDGIPLPSDKDSELIVNELFKRIMCELDSEGLKRDLFTLAKTVPGYELLNRVNNALIMTGLTLNINYDQAASISFFSPSGEKPCIVLNKRENLYLGLNQAGEQVLFTRSKPSAQCLAHELGHFDNWSRDAEEYGKLGTKKDERLFIHKWMTDLEEQRTITGLVPKEEVDSNKDYSLEVTIGNKTVFVLTNPYCENAINIAFNDPVRIAHSAGSHNTPLLKLAIYSDAMGTIRNLAEKDSSFFTKTISEDDPKYPIHLAAACNHVETLRFFLDTNPNLITTYCKNGRLPLHWSIETTSKEACQFLLDKDSSLVNSKEEGTEYRDYPLQLALKRNFGSLVPLLLEYGANPNLTDAQENTILHNVSIMPGHNDLILELLNGGADRSLRNIFGETASEYARSKCYSEAASVIDSYQSPDFHNDKKRRLDLLL